MWQLAEDEYDKHNSKEGPFFKESGYDPVAGYHYSAKCFVKMLSKVAITIEKPKGTDRKPIWPVLSRNGLFYKLRTLFVFCLYMVLQKILPYDRYVLNTQLSVEDVMNKINGIIEPYNVFRRSSGKQYMGTVTGYSFKIRRAINYRNSFLPMIKGTISANAGQTEVAIRMRPSIFSLIFMCIWLGLVGVICIGIVNLCLWHRHLFSAPMLIPFGMFAFGYCLVMIPYKIESRISGKFLAELLEGTEILGR